MVVEGSLAEKPSIVWCPQMALQCHEQWLEQENYASSLLCPKCRASFCRTLQLPWKIRLSIAVGALHLALYIAFACFSRALLAFEPQCHHTLTEEGGVNVARCLQYKVGSYRYVVDRWTQRGITWSFGSSKSECSCLLAFLVNTLFLVCSTYFSSINLFCYYLLIFVRILRVSSICCAVLVF